MLYSLCYTPVYTHICDYTMLHHTTETWLRMKQWLKSLDGSALLYGT